MMKTPLSRLLETNRKFLINYTKNGGTRSAVD
ncbi:hypothetical protein BSG1_13721 [Bacillus sp. SG-1]|nr:hypothetical protein BSG1_13721 [Bacillus sp. SG-1]